MKLYTRTPCGTGVGIDILLTGRFRELEDRPGKRITAVEISAPIECDLVVGFTVEETPKTPSGRPLLWVDPSDICNDDGSTVSQEALRVEIERVAQRRSVDAMRGPLGENWP